MDGLSSFFSFRSPSLIWLSVPTQLDISADIHMDAHGSLPCLSCVFYVKGAGSSESQQCSLAGIRVEMQRNTKKHQHMCKKKKKGVIEGA